MNRKIFKTGHSFAVTLSKKVLDDLGLKLGDDVSIDSEKDAGRVVIKPQKRKTQLALNLSAKYKLGAIPPIKK